MTLRNLVLVLGDQLSLDSAAFDGFDPARDAVAMQEVDAEVAGYPHPIRVAFFFAAMRHFRDALRARGWPVRYTDLADNRGSFGAELRRHVEETSPERLVVVEPGDHRVRTELFAAADDLGLPLEVRPDRHFYATTADFAAFAEGKKQLVMETFYRRVRKAQGVLMDGAQPIGGRWNFDAENRASFGRDGPGLLVPQPQGFPPDATTREVLDLVRRRFGNNPGSLERFDYPVTREDALAALDDFVENRLPEFGRYQDAMATGYPYLYHARISAAMNVKLLDPREAVARAERAYHEGAAPLNAVEGFVRQIIGWREFVRGVYHRFMPDYAAMNALNADLPVPDFFWEPEATAMNCVRQTVVQVRDHAYAHHIQRLMVMGLFAQLLGCHPYKFHLWHVNLFPDAIDWASLPNTLGMSQFGDGGIVGTKPYVATGKYVDRMSDYCSACRYKPGRATGDDACPFTTLYWDFLARHETALRGNHRMGFQMKNLARKDTDETRAIRARAEAIKREATATIRYPL